MPRLAVYQDGNRFYRDETNTCIYVSSIVVKDFDLNAAIAARDEFIRWCHKNGFDVLFES